MKMIVSIMEDCDSIDHKSHKGKSGGRNYMMFPEKELPEKRGRSPIFNGIFPGIWKLSLLNALHEMICFYHCYRLLFYLLGTRWCGLGDIAEGYHDLSKYRNVDRYLKSR